MSMSDFNPYVLVPDHGPQAPLGSTAATRARAEAEAPVAPGAGADERLLHAVRTAMLAPSVFNTQPWAFQPRGAGVIDLLADRSRQLPALDPEGRLLTISCGAALFLLRVGAARNGLHLRVRPLPDLNRPDLLAIVATVEISPGPPEADLLALAPAVFRRRTHRRPFEDRSVAPEAIRAMAQEAEREGAELRRAPDRIADLVADAAEALGADEACRYDVSAWLGPLGAPADAPALDGAPVHAVCEWDPRFYTTGGDSDLLAPGAGRTECERRSAADAPAVVVLTTAADNPFEWLVTGQALARVLLQATLRGVAASYLLGPVVVADVRDRLAASLGGRIPQVVLRVGHVAPGLPGGPPTPRRPLSSVLR